MNLADSAHTQTGTTVMSTDAKMQKPPLRDAVKAAVSHYLAQLDTTHTNDVYDVVIKEVEVPLLEAVLNHVGGNQTKAAATLGISRSTLRKKLTQYGIE